MKLFAVYSPNMATAMMVINTTGSADLLWQIVLDTPRPGGGGYWLVFKDEQGLRDKWKIDFPDAEVLPR
jgi:hypothetical protein